MINIKHKTKAELLLIAAVALTVAACSGGKKSGTATTEVTDNVVLDLPEDRALVNKEIKKSEGSMFEVGTSTTGTDVKAEKSNSVGNEILARLNILSSKSDGVEEVNSQLESFVSSLLERDLQEAKANFAKAEKAALALKETRHGEVVAKHGGATAIQTLTDIVKGVNILKDKKAARANELVAAINSLDARFSMLLAAKRNRAGEVAEIEGSIKVIEKKIEAAKLGKAATLEGQKEIVKSEIDILNEQIKALEDQVAFVEADFNKAYQAKRDATPDWNILGWQARGKSDETIRQEVIKSDASLQASAHLANVVKGKLAEAKAKRDAKLNQMKSTEIAAISTPAELQTELNRLRSLRSSYTRSTTTYFPSWGMGGGGNSYTSSTDYVLVDGKFMTAEALDQETYATITNRSTHLEELRSMDPKRLDPKTGKMKPSDRISQAATRSAEFYRDMISQAFDAELKKMDQLHADKKGVEERFGQEVQKADAELKIAETFLKEYSSRISNTLKTVSACQDLVLADKDSSKRTLVDSITADVTRNLVTSLVTFQDYFKDETKGEFDESMTISYQNSNDFGRFVYLMLNDKNEVVGFQTSNNADRIEKIIKGTATSSVEYRDPNDGEKPTFVKGEFDYKVNEFKTNFATPVSDLEGDSFVVAVCVQNKKGGLEYRTRKIVVRNVKAPVSSADVAR